MSVEGNHEPASQAELINVSYQNERQIAVITLTDPEHGNAMSAEMGDEFRSVVADLTASSDLRAVIIRGDGKLFSIGGHRDMLQSLGDGTRSASELKNHMMGFYDRWLSVLDLRVPIISIIHGDCIGVAPIFTCISDITIAEENASIEITFAGLGLFPGMALPYLLPKVVGTQIASWLLMSGEAISGARAEKIGLVTKSVPEGEGFTTGLGVAQKICSNAPETVCQLVGTLRVRRDQLEESLQQNARQQAFDFETAEYRKRVSNYLPDYYGPKRQKA